jgi:hypothetical protein
MYSQISINNNYIDKEIMAHFLKGKYKAFYGLGSSPCVRDTFRFKRTSDTSVQLE